MSPLLRRDLKTRTRARTVSKVVVQRRRTQSTTDAVETLGKEGREGPSFLGASVKRSTQRPQESVCRQSRWQCVHRDRVLSAFVLDPTSAEVTLIPPRDTSEGIDSSDPTDSYSGWLLSCTRSEKIETVNGLSLQSCSYTTDIHDLLTPLSDLEGHQ